MLVAHVQTISSSPLYLLAELKAGDLRLIVTSIGWVDWYLFHGWYVVCREPGLVWSSEEIERFRQAEIRKLTAWAARKAER